MFYSLCFSFPFFLLALFPLVLLLLVLFMIFSKGAQSYLTKSKLTIFIILLHFLGRFSSGIER